MRREGKSPAVSGWKNFLASIDGLLLLLIEISLVLTLFSLAYLLWGIFSGTVGRFPALPEPAQERILRNLQTSSQIFLLSVVVLAGTVLLRHYEDADAVTVVAFMGAVCWFGLPFLVKQMLEAAHQFIQNEASATLIAAFSTAGKTIVAMLALVFLRHGVRWFRLPRAAPPPSVIARLPSPLLPRGKKPTVFSPCWHLPYCREFLLPVCPAFQARKKCWKVGRGCMCDPDMFVALVKDMGAGVRGKQRTAQQYMYQTAQEQMRIKRKGDKPPCKTCFIYLEHQRLKLEFLSPFVYPASALILWGLFPLLKKGYLAFSPRLASWWATISFAVYQPGNPLEQATPMGGTHFYGFYAFLFLLGLLLVIFLIRLLEWVILKLKW